MHKYYASTDNRDTLHKKSQKQKVHSPIQITSSLNSLIQIYYVIIQTLIYYVVTR
jgi:hypothetical protein